MKRLLTLLIIAPMIAGAQTKPQPAKMPEAKGTTVTIDTMYSNGHGVFSFDSSAVWLTIDTGQHESTDTIPVMLLIIDTCGGSMVVHINGFVVRVKNWGYSYNFLNSKKKRFNRCIYVWDYKEYLFDLKEYR